MYLELYHLDVVVIEIRHLLMTLFTSGDVQCLILARLVNQVLWELHDQSGSRMVLMDGEML